MSKVPNTPAFAPSDSLYPHPRSLIFLCFLSLVKLVREAQHTRRGISKHCILNVCKEGYIRLYPSLLGAFPNNLAIELTLYIHAVNGQTEHIILINYDRQFQIIPLGTLQDEITNS